MTQKLIKSRLLYILSSMNRCLTPTISHQMPVFFAVKFPPTDAIDATSSLPSLDITASPFTTFVTIDMPYNHSDTLPFGFVLSTCSRLRRAYVSSFSRPPVGCTLCATRRTLLGSYVISVFDQPVFSPNDLTKIHTFIQSQQTLPTVISIVLAPECRSSFDDRPTPTQLRVHDLRHISALRSLTREGTTVDFN